MSNQEYQDSIIAIADHYGYESQSRQLIEEMSELTVAINKHWRKTENGESGTLEAFDIFEEIADVEVMLAQIKYLMDCEPKVRENRQNKVLRQLERIRGKTQRNKEKSDVQIPMIFCNGIKCELFDTCEVRKVEVTTWEDASNCVRKFISSLFDDEAKCKTKR